jgi:serine/threonine-protein phosphatase 2A regulatory subunit B''
MKYLRRDVIFVNLELRELYNDLRNAKSPPLDGTERINYKDFKKLGEQYGPVFANYFRATTFLKFDKDKYGRIEILAFFHYVVRKTNIEDNKINLMYSDSYCEGFLTDKDLEAYIKEEIKQFYFFEEITEDIREYYLLVAQRKFFFFLDPKRTGKININDIITSNILSEFNEMKEKPANQESMNTNNWFSLNNFWRIYKKYIDLDKDKNGMLSKEELIRYGPGLTLIFIDRIFEEYQKYENAIDFKQFIDFVLAMENRKTPASIQYLWRAIDVYHKNAVDTFVLNMFYRQVIKKLANRAKDGYKIDDIKDELWDMIKPKNPNYITLQDVLNSTYSDTVLSLLIDAKAFYLHDQKENQYVDEFEDIDNEYL